MGEVGIRHPLHVGVRVSHVTAVGYQGHADSVAVQQLDLGFNGIAEEVAEETLESVDHDVRAPVQQPHEIGQAGVQVVGVRARDPVRAGADRLLDAEARGGDAQVPADGFSPVERLAGAVGPPDRQRESREGVLGHGGRVVGLGEVSRKQLTKGWGEGVRPGGAGCSGAQLEVTLAEHLTLRLPTVGVQQVRGDRRPVASGIFKDGGDPLRQAGDTAGAEDLAHSGGAHLLGHGLVVADDQWQPGVDVLAVFRRQGQIKMATGLQGDQPDIGRGEIGGDLAGWHVVGEVHAIGDPELAGDLGDVGRPLLLGIGDDGQMYLGQFHQGSDGVVDAACFGDPSGIHHERGVLTQSDGSTQVRCIGGPVGIGGVGHYSGELGKLVGALEEFCDLRADGHHEVGVANVVALQVDAGTVVVAVGERLDLLGDALVRVVDDPYRTPAQPAGGGIGDGRRQRSHVVDVDDGGLQGVQGFSEHHIEAEIVAALRGPFRECRFLGSRRGAGASQQQVLAALGYPHGHDRRALLAPRGRELPDGLLGEDGYQQRGHAVHVQRLGLRFAGDSQNQSLESQVGGDTRGLDDARIAANTIGDDVHQDGAARIVSLL